VAELLERKEEETPDVEENKLVSDVTA